MSGEHILKVPSDQMKFHNKQSQLLTEKWTKSEISSIIDFVHGFVQIVDVTVYSA